MMSTIEIDGKAKRRFCGGGKATKEKVVLLERYDNGPAVSTGVGVD